MRRNAITLLATAALATTLAACGGTGTGSTGSATTDDTTETNSSTTKDEKDTKDEGKGVESDDKGDADSKIAGTDDTKVAAMTDAEKSEARSKAEAAGKTVLTGTVVMVDGPDIFKYENIDPSVMGGAQSEEGNTYAILQLDEETKISGMGADGFAREETHDLIGLGHDLPKYEDIKDTASQWKQYDGQRVCVAGDAVFPTDVSFPTAGTLHDTEVLYAEDAKE